MIREWSFSCHLDGTHHPCDSRDEESIRTAKTSFPYIDYDGVEEKDPIPKAESLDGLKGRIEEFLKVLRKYHRGDGSTSGGDIIVVTHRGFLRMFFKCVFKKEVEKSFENCEVATALLDDVLSAAENNGYLLQ